MEEGYATYRGVIWYDGERCGIEDNHLSQPINRALHTSLKLDSKSIEICRCERANTIDDRLDFYP